MGRGQGRKMQGKVVELRVKSKGTESWAPLHAGLLSAQLRPSLVLGTPEDCPETKQEQRQVTKSLCTQSPQWAPHEISLRNLPTGREGEMAQQIPPHITSHPQIPSLDLS